MSNPTMVRSNIFVQAQTQQFIKEEAKEKRTSTGSIVDIAIRALKREKIRQQMISFYEDPAAIQEERQLAEASFIINQINE
jgi:hypothetical protein